ncbi:murein transglycosylase A [Sphingomonas mucosissima]|uniref:peptidoglycan lytic exotransglycosylase n=1 Tax=Sphingomonas mucosissima TaxID=370959 RepID=A0A245ZQB5_9SPHN|nr:murein transglycosylase A [Sphingomonas mucosissima]OWK31943.1 membrane-bound lytic murein transglycosylase A precursor [Sphingomonas mucosissima]
MLGRGGIALAAALALSACVGGVVPPSSWGSAPVARPSVPTRPGGPVRQPTQATPIAPIPSAPVAGALTAATAGLVSGPPVSSLPITGDGAERALGAFRISCPSLVRRTDPTGLTRGADWKPACDAAARGGDARAFFARWFETVQVGDGKAFATGYYIPEIAGSRSYRAGYAPIYARPSDLVDVDLGQFSADLKGKKIRGRVEGTNFVPYYDRTMIEEGALTGKARILGYAVDPVELFFLQVQGSGLVRMPDGDVLRIGYDSQNGRDYTGIGKLMLDRGLIGRGEASMQGIVAWLHANPEQGRAIMRENKSFVFFRVLDGPPLGAMGLPVSDQATVAADTRFVPLGAPVFLSMDRTDATGLWVAQDTGGAIKGTNRFDTFWGAGEEARAIAGGMSARGTAFLLLPTGTLARLGVARP